MRGTNDSACGPDWTHEARLQGRHGGHVAGIDEAGRGPWAGPVVAAAVILDPDSAPAGLNDSKKLKEPQREALFDRILACAFVGVGIADVARIDRDNILQATLWAMAEALAALPEKPSCALIDGNKCPDLPCPAEPLVKGDALSLSIAAASIIAKVSRDRIMRDAARAYPPYGWERNKGYGTKQHAAALARHGATPFHRHSYKPVRAALARSAAVRAG